MYFTDSFTVDASGQADPCTVPPEANGAKKLTLVPPAGHAWTLFMPGPSVTGVPMSTDQIKEVMAPNGCNFITGDTPLYASLDTGSNTMGRIWEG